VRHRRADLQTGTPKRLEIYLVIPGSRADERALHQRFAKYRLKGEWFLFADELADWIEMESGGLSKRRLDRRAEKHPTRLSDMLVADPNPWIREHAYNEWNDVTEAF
jgi:hypothetical protein